MVGLQVAGWELLENTGAGNGASYSSRRSGPSASGVAHSLWLPLTLGNVRYGFTPAVSILSSQQPANRFSLFLVGQR